MHILIITAHPLDIEERRSLISQSIYQWSLEYFEKYHYTQEILSLYSNDFNPVLSNLEYKNYYNTTAKKAEDIILEQKKISKSDLLFFMYPIWWYDIPAILKGWLDRVFTPGFAFTTKNTGLSGTNLKGKKSILVQSFGGYADNSKKETSLSKSLVACGVLTHIFNLERAEDNTIFEKPDVIEGIRNRYISFLDKSM